MRRWSSDDSPFTSIAFRHFVNNSYTQNIPYWNVLLKTPHELGLSQIAIVTNKSSGDLLNDTYYVLEREKQETLSTLFKPFFDDRLLLLLLSLFSSSLAMASKCVLTPRDYFIWHPSFMSCVSLWCFLSSQTLYYLSLHFVSFIIT